MLDASILVDAAQREMISIDNQILNVVQNQGREVLFDANTTTLSRLRVSQAWKRPPSRPLTWMKWGTQAVS